MSWLSDRLEEAWAQINVFDGGKSASTVRATRAQQQAPAKLPDTVQSRVQNATKGVLATSPKAREEFLAGQDGDQIKRNEEIRRLQREALRGQISGKVAAAKIRASSDPEAVQRQTAKNVLKVDNPVQNSALSAVTGVGRSIAGTGESASGLYDLLTPGKGQNRFGQKFRRWGEQSDELVNDLGLSKGVYKGAQIGTDIPTFYGAGALGFGKGIAATTKLVPGVTARTSSAVNALANTGRVGNLTARTGRYLARPDITADILVDGAFNTGLRSNRGEAITPTTALVDFGTSAGAAIGLKVAGEGLKYGSRRIARNLQELRNIQASPLPGPRLIDDQAGFVNPDSLANFSRKDLDDINMGRISDVPSRQKQLQRFMDAGIIEKAPEGKGGYQFTPDGMKLKATLDGNNYMRGDYKFVPPETFKTASEPFKPQRAEMYGDSDIQATYKGKPWRSNAYIAEPGKADGKYAKPGDFKGKESISDKSKQPKLDEILRVEEAKTPAKRHAYDAGTNTLVLDANGKARQVNAGYLNYLTKKAKNPKILVNENDPYAPVVVKDGNKVVGVVMPLKGGSNNARIDQIKLAKGEDLGFAPDGQKADPKPKKPVKTEAKLVEKPTVQDALQGKSTKVKPQPIKLNQNPSEYFNVDKDTVNVPLDKIKLSKTPAQNVKGRANAPKLMQDAYDGKIPKRGPITVKENGDGTYTIVDGNATFSAGKNNGWKEMPVKIQSETGVSTETVSPKIKMDAELAIQRAAKYDADFQASIKKIADDIGYGFESGRVKGLERTSQKLQQDYGGDVSKLRDIVRNTVFVDNLNDTSKAIDAISKAYPVDRIKPLKTMTGYKDIKVTSKLPDGSFAETILITKPMLDAKEKIGHDLYDKTRVKEVDINHFLNKAQARVYAEAEALNSPTRAIQDSLETFSPRSKARSTGYSAPVQDVPTTSSPSLSKRTGTSPSMSKNSGYLSESVISDPLSTSTIANNTTTVKPSVEDALAGKSTKLSRYANKTVQETDEVSKPLKKLVKEEKVTYTATTDAERTELAKKFLKGKSDEDAFNQVIRDLDSMPKESNGQENFNALELIKKLDNQQDDNSLFKATEIFHKMSEDASSKGQQIQALAALKARTPAGLQHGAIRDLERSGIKVTPDHQKAIKDLTDEVRKAGDDENLANIARYKVRKYVSDQIPVGKASKLINLWRAGLLTAPTTTAGNLLGNSGEAAVRKAWVNPLATAIDMGFSLKTGKRTIAITDRGFSEGVKDGAGRLETFLKTGYDERNALSKYDTREISYGDGPIGKVVGKYVNGVYRLMSIADQPYWYGARGEALASMAKAEAINKNLTGEAKTKFIADFMNNPPTRVLERATEEAKYSTFQNKTVLGQIASKGKKPAGAVGDFFVPFTQVPASIATRIITRTPVGTANEVVKQIANIKKGGKFDQRAMSQSIAEGSFGPAVFGVGYALAQSGQLTFGYPQEKKERELWEAEGKQPYSVKVGDRWYSMNYLQPFGTLLSMGGEAHEAIKDGASVPATISRGIATAGQSVMNQSFLKGVSGVLEVIDDPKRYAENYVSNTAGSIVPNLIRSGARASDNVQRETRGAVAGIKGALPGLRQTLPTKLDMFGQDVPAKDNFANQFLNPLRPSKDRSGDPVATELRRLLDVDAGVLPTAATKSSFSNMKLSDQQVRDINKLAGPAMKEAYAQTITMPEYKKLSDPEKAKALKKVNDTVYGSLKAKYGVENGLITAEQAKLDTKQKRYLNSGELASLTSDTEQTYAEEYESKLAQFNENKANMSRLERTKAQKDIRRLAVKKDFDRDIVGLYGMSKSDAYDFLSTDPDGKKMSEKLLAYGDAMVDAGLYSYNKFRDRNGNVSIQPKSRGRGGGRGGSKKRARKDFSLYSGGGLKEAISVSSALRKIIADAKIG